MRIIELSASAKSFLSKVDKPTAKKLVHKINLLSTNPQTLQIKKLKGEKGVYRIRQGNFRILFEIYEEVILITKIGDRKDIYK